MKKTIEENIPLAPLTSFKVGGSARYLLEPSSHEDLTEGLNWAEQNRVEVFMLGRGTNLVFSDAGFDGLVIHMGKSLSSITWNGPLVTAGAGVLLHTLVSQSVDRGYAGIQNLAGIPGTMGGGLYINAGAFGQELCQTTVLVRSCDREGGLIERKAEDCDFGYRHSLFCDREETILEVCLKLESGDQRELKKEVREILHKRKQKQPLDFPNAGSMFKRPPGDYAGRLIEQAELKGRCCGGAQVSEKHANFIINRGSATAQDIYDLSEEVIQIVKGKSGVALEREVRMIGEFLPWPR